MRQRTKHAAAEKTGDQPAQLLFLMLEHEAAIARKRLVGAVARERNRHLLAREFADAIGRQRTSIGEGFVEHVGDPVRSEEHTSELQSLMRSTYAVFCLKKKTQQ